MKCLKTGGILGYTYREGRTVWGSHLDHIWLKCLSGSTWISVFRLRVNHLRHWRSLAISHQPPPRYSKCSYSFRTTTPGTNVDVCTGSSSVNGSQRGVRQSRWRRMPLPVRNTRRRRRKTPNRKLPVRSVEASSAEVWEANRVTMLTVLLWSMLC